MKPMEEKEAEMRAKHDKGGVNVCVMCLKRARDTTASRTSLGGACDLRGAMGGGGLALGAAYVLTRAGGGKADWGVPTSAGCTGTVKTSCSSV